MADREDRLYSAKLAEQADRFEDMRDQIKKIVEMKVALTVDERNLLSVAYKNIVGTRRTAWRVLSNLELKEKEKETSSVAKVCEDYRKSIEADLFDVCHDLLRLIDNYLLESSENDADSQIFYEKMKGDYYRYIAEVQETEERKKTAELALKAYQKASESAATSLVKTHPIRLGLALNFSVFHYEILNSPKHAIALARSAFDDAISELDQLNEESYKDSTLIMQLIRDNLSLWSNDVKPDEEEDDENSPTKDGAVGDNPEAYAAS
ncbi:uncharacterized protein LOC134853104 [Symsagittifera roscoffensis]|uniref:uncharacterized protein LOC134853104 n=1 Tax=Symsagittifera roscoffensis TaxID=84072 RepID=UPI00307BE740